MRESFETLVGQHKKILFRVCNVYCKNAADREDLAQEIMIQLWRSFPSFDNRSLFSTWMYRIAINVAIDFFRRESSRARHVVSGELDLANPATEPSNDSSNLRTLYEFIATLDPLNRALVMLYLDGNTYREIAEVLGITETNVATKINRLKRKGTQYVGTR